MSEMLLENSVSRAGVRVVHVIGSAPVSKVWREYVPSAAKATEKRWEDEAGMHHLTVTWQAREIVAWTFSMDPRVVIRRNVALWYVEPGQRVSEAIVQAAEVYALGLGKDPLYAFMRQLPGKVEDGFEFVIREGGARIMLVQREWVPERFVMLDSGGATPIPAFPQMQKRHLGEGGKQLKLV